MGSFESLRIEQEQGLWIALTELFFLDTESQDYAYAHVVRLLKEAGWNREKTRKTLIELIAPVAGRNLGFLLWPTIGEWEGFDKASLCKKIQRVSENRAKQPKWFFIIPDWYCERMLKKLDMDCLLKKMIDPR